MTNVRMSFVLYIHLLFMVNETFNDLDVLFSTLFALLGGKNDVVMSETIEWSDNPNVQMGMLGKRL